MSQLDKETIIYLSQLSRIDCSEDEQVNILSDLKKILAYMEALQEIDTAGVAPCNQVLQYDHDATRDDAVAELLSREEFLSNAPAHIGGMIKVPPVLKTS